MTQKFLEPLDINGMIIKNRLGFAPMLNMPHGPGDLPDEQTIRWFEERAESGLGLIMTGALGAVGAPGGRPQATAINLGLGMNREDHAEAWSKVFKVVQSHGAKVGVQIVMGGIMGGMAPSLGPYPDEENATLDQFKINAGIDIPAVELTVEQLEQLEDGFARSAALVKQAGADCVQLHCAHGGATLHCSFISPYYNKRTDQYGGSWENRLRLPVRTIQKMREAVGPDFPILVRLSADQLVGDRGITLEDTTRYIVPMLEEAGVDCFDISQGDILRAPEGILISMENPRGCYIHFAEAVKKVTTKPVIGVGRIIDIDMAERFLQDDKADVIYMPRQFTADLDTLHKYLDGRKDEIRLCTACNEGCGTPCPQNYAISPDAKPLQPAEVSKKVLVIGGGVGGMEAARVCAERGHQVTLVEKSAELGGIVGTLALTPKTAELHNVVNYLGTQMRAKGVDVRMCKEVTAEDVAEMAPDSVIVSTGAEMWIPDQAKDLPSVLTHLEALQNPNRVGKRVVIWGLVATDLALSLAEGGKDVVIFGRGGVETMDKYVSAQRRWHSVRKLTDVPVPRASEAQKRVTNPEALFHTKIEEITASEITLILEDGTARILPYDSLIISLSRNPDETLYEKLRERVTEVYKVGDQINLLEGSNETANIKGAVWTANEVAREI